MKPIISRSVLTLTVISGLSIIAPLPAAQAEPFLAVGSYLDTSGKKNTTAGNLSGVASPGGLYAGEYWHKKRDNLTVLEGRSTVSFEDGSSLTFDYDLVYDPETNLYIGAYVIHGGDGALKTASGTGQMIVEPAVEHEGMFWLAGDLFLD